MRKWDSIKLVWTIDWWSVCTRLVKGNVPTPYLSKLLKRLHSPFMWQTYPPRKVPLLHSLYRKCNHFRLSQSNLFVCSTVESDTYNAEQSIQRSFHFNLITCLNHFWSLTMSLHIATAWVQLHFFTHCLVCTSNNVIKCCIPMTWHTLVAANLHLKFTACHRNKWVILTFEIIFLQCPIRNLAFPTVEREIGVHQYTMWDSSV